MIILDTNVVSELIKGTPEPKVRAWAYLQRPDQLMTTAINVMELRAGVEKLLHSRRRRELDASLDWALDDLLGSRVLRFDRHAALAAQSGMPTADALAVLSRRLMRRSPASPSPATSPLPPVTSTTLPALA